MPGKATVFTRCLVLAILISLLTACGFSLRGSAVSLTDSLPSLALNLQQPNSEFSRYLQQTLTSSRVQLIAADVEAEIPTPVLSVSAERFQVQPVSVNPLARAAQYEILLAVTFALHSGAESLLQEQEIAVREIYFENTESLPGSQEEMQLIQDDLRRELVDILLRRLEGVNRQT